MGFCSLLLASGSSIDRTPDSGIHGFKDSGFKDPGIRDSGSGIRDPGSGIRDPGFGIRDSGFGISDKGFGIQCVCLATHSRSSESTTV